MDENDQEEKLKIIKDCDKTKKDIAKEKYLEKGRYYKENKRKAAKNGLCWCSTLSKEKNNKKREYGKKYR